MKRQDLNREELEGPPSRIDVYAAWIAEDATVIPSEARNLRTPQDEILRCARNDKRVVRPTPDANARRK